MRFHLRRHGVFLAVLGLSALLRLDALLGYRSILGSVDTPQYVSHAVTLTPSPIRPVGYSLFLAWLPGVFWVAVAQHLLTLAAGAAIYLLLHGRFGISGWVAALATVPYLLEPFQLYLGHAMATEALFTALVAGAVVALLWRERPGPALAAAGTTLFALAALVRTIGLPLLAVGLVWLLARRANWRVLAAAVAAAALPLAGYAAWFHATSGRYALTRYSGIFLYGKTMTFADCAKIPLTVRERALCPGEPVGRRLRSRIAAYYISGSPRTPLGRLGRFAPGADELAGSFARKAILAQPGDYLRVVLRDVTHALTATSEPSTPGTFGWFYRFPTTAAFQTDTIVLRDRPERSTGFGRAVRAYDPGYPGLRIVEPYAGWLRDYQRYARLPGPGLAVMLLLGAGGVVRRRAALLPWSVASILLVAALATSDYDPRYPAVCGPVAGMAAAFAVAPARRDPAGSRKAAPALVRTGG